MLTPVRFNNTVLPTNSKKCSSMIILGGSLLSNVIILFTIFLYLVKSYNGEPSICLKIQKTPQSDLRCDVSDALPRDSVSRMRTRSIPHVHCTLCQAQHLFLQKLPLEIFRAILDK